MSRTSITLASAGATLLAGCANLATIAPPVSPAMVAASGGTSAATLNAGRDVYATQCTACHSADPVTKRTFAEWRTTVATMSPRAKLTSEQESALLAYLHAAPKAAETQPAR